MNAFVYISALIMFKLIADSYNNDINGPEQTFLAIISSFLCDLFFWEYLLLRRQRNYFLVK